MRNSSDTAATALNRFFTLTNYSLARYLNGASPWLRVGDAALEKLVKEIGEEHEGLAIRAAHLILARRAVLDAGNYPSQIMGCNDLALEYLAGQLIAHVGRMIAEMETCLKGLSHDDEAASLIGDAIKSQRARLIDLEALAQSGGVLRVPGTFANIEGPVLRASATPSPAVAAISRDCAVGPYVAA